MWWARLGVRARWRLIDWYWRVSVYLRARAGGRRLEQRRGKQPGQVRYQLSSFIGSKPRYSRVAYVIAVVDARPMQRLFSAVDTHTGRYFCTARQHGRRAAIQ